MKSSGFTRSSRQTAHPRWSFALILSLFVFGAAGLVALRAAAPLAGTVIGNAASATYKDNANVERQVTSNVVTTIVQQVYSFTLTADRSATVSPGGQVFFPHTLTNTGNGSDSYTLTTTGATNFTTGGSPLTNIAIYADVNQDGVPDDNVNLAGGSAIPLAAGVSYHVVVVGSAPATVTGSATVDIVATATATQTPQSADNTDTATVTNNAVVTVTKAINRSSGPSPVDAAASIADPLTYTLTYTNTGNTAATGVTLTDLIPTNLIYVAGSARWSSTGATVLTDAAGGNQSGITYDFGVTANTVTAVIDVVNPGASGTLSFQVRVTPNTAPQVITNTARYTYDPDGAGPEDPIDPTLPSNPVPYTVTQRADVWIGQNTNANAELAPGVDVAFPGLNGTVSGANPGAVLTYVNRVYNKGNGTDAFDITLPASTFPAGTTVFLYKTDGNTPLVDTTGNGTPDTGPLAPAASYDVVVKVILPNDAPVGAGPHDITVRATSAFDGSVANTTFNRLTAVTALRVDLTDHTDDMSPEPAGITLVADGGEGYFSAGGTADDIIRRNTTNPGQTTTFRLAAANDSVSTPDSYNIRYGSTSGLAAMPAGWTVVINESPTITTGGSISNTGVVAPGAAKTFYAHVTPPASAAPGDVNVFFKISSPTTFAEDTINDVVRVNTIRLISLTPNNVGQTYPGGIVIYDHTLTNHGNVTEGNTVGSNIAINRSETLGGWNSVIYYDANNDGAISAGEPIVTHLNFASGGNGNGLLPGESVRLLVKVFAPAGAPNLASNITTIATVTTAGSVNNAGALADVSATDTTTVVLGDLTIEKEQSLTGAGGWTKAQLTLEPGESIYYRITVKNTGSAASTEVFIYDSVPAFTTYVPASAQLNGGTTGVTVSVPNLSFNVGSLSPGASAVATFAVTVDSN